MGRKSRSRALSIWANGERVGTWVIPATGDMELRYAPAWKTSRAGRPLSLSLPFGWIDAAAMIALGGVGSGVYLAARHG